MPVPANLVHETTTGTGTGNLTIAQASGKQRFSAAFGTGGTTNVFDYFIAHRTANEWEYGTGHASDANTLVRDTVINSSNSNNVVNFSAGTKDVTNDVPASFFSMAQSTVKGRAAGAGTGFPSDLTPAQLMAMQIGEAAVFDTLRYKRSHNIDGTNLNDLGEDDDTGESGFFDGSGLTNAPEGSSAWFFIYSQRHTNSNGYSFQLAWPLDGNTAWRMWMRHQTGTSWSAWRLISTGSRVVFGGVLEPAQITANQNDYNPSGLADTSILRINADADDRIITGIVGGTDGRILIIMNNGTTRIQLQHDDGSTSTAANRFHLNNNNTLLASANNFILSSRDCVMLVYDEDALRWRQLSANLGGLSNAAIGTGLTLSSAQEGTLGLSDMAQSTIKGRAAGAGTGAPTDLSASQARDVIGRQYGRETFWIPAGAMNPYNAASASRGTYVAPSANVVWDTIDYADGLDLYATCNWTPPKSWDGSGITYVAYWTATSGSGTVHWGFYSQGFGDGDSIGGVGNAAGVNDAYQGADLMHISGEAGAVSPTNAVDGDVIHIIVGREASDAGDNFTGTARLLGIKVYYVVDAGNDT